MVFTSKFCASRELCGVPVGLVGGSGMKYIAVNLVGVQLVYRLMCLLEWKSV